MQLWWAWRVRIYQGAGLGVLEARLVVQSTAPESLRLPPIHQWTRCAIVSSLPPFWRRKSVCWSPIICPIACQPWMNRTPQIGIGTKIWMFLWCNSLHWDITCVRLTWGEGLPHYEWSLGTFIGWLVPILDSKYQGLFTLLPYWAGQWPSVSWGGISWSGCFTYDRAQYAISPRTL